ncbi:metalloprotease [Halostagnicola kamekurae]|uniref:Zn-dependent protease (Includes SpoIVFB) n=1 Tax=Halostagnicola kamekurae TaxID=619731 RepID=A0A1I6QW34_9EURY|nr:metalloprotease [Halostagnicola kamekurae]SFS56458.1 Zn-dependent protease (includes SpoIVFB) [Halostagnicola kamekurae]
MSYPTQSELQFSDEELIDLAAAWITLSVAFALLLNPIHLGVGTPTEFVLSVGLSFVTVGVGFLCHELAHKVVAIRYGQIAEFRADYQMLFLAIMSALIGFLFAAPGAVYHAGRITERENAMIALAGPLTNHGLALLFFPLMVLPGIGIVGHMGVLINLFLAAFNMVPFGPLDGKSVWNWNKGVFAGIFVTSGALLIGFLFMFGTGF